MPRFTEKIDIWALGLVAVAALRGAAPFPADLPLLPFFSGYPDVRMRAGSHARAMCGRAGHKGGDACRTRAALRLT